MDSCPNCGTPNSLGPAPGDTNSVTVVRPQYTRDKGGCLVIALLGVGAAALIWAVNWLGSLVGLHLWQWMTSPWPGPQPLARTVFVFVLTIFALVLLLRRWVLNRFQGPEIYCGVCGYVERASAGRGASRPVRVMLSVLLGFILLCLGVCSFGKLPGDEPEAEVPASAVCNFDSTQVRTCTSANPAVSINQQPDPKAAACKFSHDIVWSDDTPHTVVNTQGGGTGPKSVAQHTYAKAGVYKIYLTATPTGGSCKPFGEEFTFTYKP